MLRSIEDMEKCDVQANDGAIGHVRDFIFDDDSWVVRYAVVDTCGWLLGREVLISPISIGLVDSKKKHLQVLLDRDQIENSPDFDRDILLSRRYERRYVSHYSHPCYWGGRGLWGAGSSPSLMVSDIDRSRGKRHLCGPAISGLRGWPAQRAGKGPRHSRYFPS